MAERIPETNSVTNVEEYGESIAKQAVEDALSSLSLNEKVQSTSHNNGKPTSNQDLNRLVKIEAKDQSTDNDVLKVSC
jgi:predicted nucleic acid-binding protein